MKSSKKECYFAGAYTRLSQDDGDKAESDSIRNQKELIRNFQKSHSEIHIVEEYSDDGYSGVNFERPGFQKMITDIHEKKIDCIIVKDLSRFGRNYIETGKYIEQIFPALDVRFIAINDNYDSAEKRQPGDQIILPFKNLVNDAYSRDLSVKIRSNLNAKRKQEQAVEKLAVSRDEVYQCAVYIRLSKEENEKSDSHKLDNQEQVILNYVRKNPDLKIVKIYCDNGYSGTNFSRAAFGEMMQDIKSGIIRCVIVKDLSRLGRNHIETEQYIRTVFPFFNVRFIAVNDHFDSLHPEGDLMASLKNIINDAYAKDISRKIFTVKQNQRLKGEFVGNIPPYGYEKSVEDGHKLVINEETAPVIRKIFQLKEQKKTNTEIAKILEEEREIAPMTYWYRKGKVHHEKYAHRTWEATTIKTILANQMYTGDMVQGKKQKCIAEGRNTQKKQKEEDYVIVPNTHEALIDRSLFDKVQKICRKELEANREKRKKYTNVSSTEDLLKNKIFSAEGLKMYRGRNVYKNERVTYNYVTSKSRKNDGTCYKFVYISEEKVFQALKKAIYFYIELLFSIEDGHMDRKRKEKAEIEQKQLKKEIANSQKNVEWYTRRLADTYKEKTEGKIQMEDYIKKQTEYRACKEAAQEKIKELSDKYEIYKMQLLGNPDYFAVYENFLKTEELNKMLIDVLVKKITVAENAKIEITFQFEDEMRMLYERLKESCSA